MAELAESDARCVDGPWPRYKRDPWFRNINHRRFNVEKGRTHTLRELRLRDERQSWRNHAR